MHSVVFRVQAKTICPLYNYIICRIINKGIETKACKWQSGLVWPTGDPSIHNNTWLPGITVTGWSGQRLEESQAGPEGLSDSPLFSRDQVCGGSSEVPGMVLSSHSGAWTQLSWNRRSRRGSWWLCANDATQKLVDQSQWQWKVIEELWGVDDVIMPAGV